MSIISKQKVVNRESKSGLYTENDISRIKSTKLSEKHESNITHLMFKVRNNQIKIFDAKKIYKKEQKKNSLLNKIKDLIA